jgi:tellurite resistance protein
VVVADLLDPVAAPFASLALITPMLLASLGLYPHAAVAGRVVTDMFLVLTVLLGGWLTGQWIYRPLDVDRFHPGYFLPTVAGGLIAAAAAAHVGQLRLGQALFGLGVVCWIMLGSVILGRLLLRPMLPPPLQPTLAIEVAPAAVASLAWFALHGAGIGEVAAFLAGYGLLMVLAQLRLLPAYLSLPFMPSTWSFTFSWAAVVTVALTWLQDSQVTGYRAWQYVLAAAITLLIGGIAARTVIALGRRQLLRTPSPSRAPQARHRHPHRHLPAFDDDRANHRPKQSYRLARRRPNAAACRWEPGMPPAWLIALAAAAYAAADYSRQWLAAVSAGRNRVLRLASIASAGFAGKCAEWMSRSSRTEGNAFR